MYSTWEKKNMFIPNCRKKKNLTVGRSLSRGQGTEGVCQNERKRHETSLESCQEKKNMHTTKVPPSRHMSPSDSIIWPICAEGIMVTQAYVFQDNCCSSGSGGGSNCCVTAYDGEWTLGKSESFCLRYCLKDTDKTRELILINCH